MRIMPHVDVFLMYLWEKVSSISFYLIEYLSSLIFLSDAYFLLEYNL